MYRTTTVAILTLSILSVGLACASAPTDPTVRNLRAFAKAYGYVRYFHPSDAAADVDWDAFAARGARRVSDAASPEELRGVLADLFAPVAPSVRFTRSSADEPPAPEWAARSDTSDLDVVVWQHVGMGTDRVNSVYRSARMHRVRELTTATGNAVVSRSLDAEALRGREIRFTGSLLAESPDTRAHLWFRVDRPSGTGFFDNMMDRSVTSETWTEAEIRGMVDEDARRVVLGALILGGDASVDDLRLEARDGDAWVEIPLSNAGFELDRGGSPPGWNTTGPGWNIETSSDRAIEGERRLAVRAGRTRIAGPLFERHPAPGERHRGELGYDLVAWVPLSIWSEDGRTLDVDDPEEPGIDTGTPSDREIRLADVIVTWNAFQHFYPYWDVVDADWDAVLTEALERVVADPSGDRHRTTLRAMVAALGDGHGSVSDPDGQTAGRLPFAMEWVEDSVVVVAPERASAAAHDSARDGASAGKGPASRGDVVLAIDGQDAGELLASEVELESGTLRWRRWKAVRSLGAGSIGSEARVVLRRHDGAIDTLVLNRVAGSPPAEGRPEQIATLESGILYVDLDRAPMAAIESRLDELARARAVIFDLRGYPNGNHVVLTHLSDEPLRSAHWMTPEIVRPDGAGEAAYRESRWHLAPGEPRFDGRAIFLTDGRAISYAESVMGIVEAYGLGPIVGEATAGANGNVNVLRLPSGHTIRWTGMRVEKHDRSQHHLVGIEPTHPAGRTIEGVRAGRDEVLERALELARDGS